MYSALFLFLIGGALGLPIPEEMALISAGILLQTSKIDLELTVVVCFLGLVIGDVMIYFIGRYFGITLLKKRWFKSRVPVSKIKSMRLKLESRSILMIFIARHLFYLRTATFLTCGAVRMNFKKFLLADSAAASISLPLMIGLGYLAAEHYESVLAWLEKARNLTIFLVLIVVGVYILRRRRKSVANSLEGTSDSKVEGAMDSQSQ